MVYHWKVDVILNENKINASKFSPHSFKRLRAVALKLIAQNNRGKLWIFKQEITKEY